MESVNHGSVWYALYKNSQKSYKVQGAEGCSFWLSVALVDEAP